MKNKTYVPLLLNICVGKFYNLKKLSIFHRFNTHKKDEKGILNRKLGFFSIPNYTETWDKGF